MSIFHLAIAASSACLLTACAWGQPHSYAQTRDTDPNFIYQSTELYQPPAAPAVQYAAENTPVPATVRPRYVRVNTTPNAVQQPKLIRAAAQMPQVGGALQWNTHVVKEGDTAYSLGKRYCSETKDIQRYNGLDRDYSLQVGQAILLPRTMC